jgi:hypothetical protein
VLNGPEDAVEPHVLHPIFHGSFDWHSCVHGWWQVLRLARLYPDLPESAAVRARADAMLMPDKVSGELAFLSRPNSAGFERPYGWAWLLILHDEVVRHDAPWGAALEPLARAFADRFKVYLPKLTYPIRVGTHFNSAFALTLAHGWAARHDLALLDLVEARARDWFIADRDCQAWEPGGDEFLSPALCEATLLAQVLPADHFADWFGCFLPGAGKGQPATLFEPAFVSDRGDGKIAHLDGLNLSRAWCWRRIGAKLGGEPFEPVAQRHLESALPHLADDYVGEHWLCSFALLALDGAG